MGIPTRSWTSALGAGTAADGAEVESFLDILADELDPGVSGINDANIVAGADINAAKLLDGSIGVAKIAAGVLTGDRFALNTIEDNKLLIAHADGAKFPRLAAAQRKMAYGTVAIVVANGTTEKIQAVVFNTDGADTPGNFANTTDLVILLTAEYDPAVVTEGVVTTAVDNMTTTGFDAQVILGGAAGAERTFTLHWMAMGRSA